MSSRKRHHDTDTEWTSEKWYSDFFCNLAIETNCAKQYADAFASHGLRWVTFKMVTNDHLHQMGITKIGHCIEILSQRDQMQLKEPDQPSKQSRSGKTSSPSKRSQSRSEISRSEPRLESRVTRVEPRDPRNDYRETRGENRIVRGSSSPIEIRDSPPPQLSALNGNGITRGQFVEVSSTTQAVGPKKVRYDEQIHVRNISQPFGLKPQLWNFNYPRQTIVNYNSATRSLHCKLDKCVHYM